MIIIIPKFFPKIFYFLVLIKFYLLKINMFIKLNTKLNK